MTKIFFCLEPAEGRSNGSDPATSVRFWKEVKREFCMVVPIGLSGKDKGKDAPRTRHPRPPRAIEALRFDHEGEDENQDDSEIRNVRLWLALPLWANH